MAASAPEAMAPFRARKPASRPMTSTKNKRSGEVACLLYTSRALLNEPGFVNRMRAEENARCNGRHSNYCIARMYSIEMACHQHLKEELPPVSYTHLDVYKRQAIQQAASKAWAASSMKRVPKRRPFSSR